MWLFVFLFSNLWGTRVGAGLSARLVDPSHDNAFLCTVMQLPAIFVGTLIKNFPMALLWNLFAAGPITRLVFAKRFSHAGEKQGEAAPEGAEV